MICRYCGAEFEPKKRGRKNTGFCCHKCADAWRQHNVYDLMPKKFTKQCDYCGEEFQTNRKGQKYCSTKCRGAASRGRTEYTKTCLYCSTEFKTIYKNYKYWLNKWLHEHGIQYKQGKMWHLYQKYAGKGYTHSKTYAIPDDSGDSHAKPLTCWAMKGRLFLYELLKSHGFLLLIEQVTADDEA